MDNTVIYKGQKLILTEFHDRPCLWITSPDQISMEGMHFVGGYPNEYCIFLDELSDKEKRTITDAKGKKVHVTLKGVLAKESGSRKKRRLEENAKSEKRCRKATTIIHWIAVLLFIPCFIGMILNWHQGYHFRYAETIFLYMLIPLIFLITYLVLKISWKKLFAAERAAIEREYGYNKAVVTKQKLELYVGGSEEVETVLLKDILKVSYEEDSNLLTILYNSRSRTDPNTYYEAKMEIEDVFVPPLRSSLM